MPASLYSFLLPGNLMPALENCDQVAPFERALTYGARGRRFP